MIGRATDTKLGREVAIKVLPPRMGPALAALAQTYAKAGRVGEARALAVRIAGDPTLRNSLDISRIYALLDQADEAFHWLELAATERQGYFPWLASIPELKPLHSDQRFWELVQRYELPTE